jgi:hypothetical protein
MRLTTREKSLPPKHYMKMKITRHLSHLSEFKSEEFEANGHSEARLRSEPCFGSGDLKGKCFDLPCYTRQCE